MPLDPVMIASLQARLDAATMLKHPEFRSAVHGYTEQLLAQRRGERLLNKLLAQREREMIGFLILVEHYATCAGKPPLTMGRLLTSGFGSARRIAGFVQLLRWAGLAHVGVDPTDGRRRIVTPSVRLIALHRNWTLAALRQIDRFLEQPVLEQVFHRFPDFHGLACRIGAEEIFQGQAFAVGLHPLVDFLTPYRGGHLIAASLAHASYVDGRQINPVALSYGRLARRLGVSRSHIMNVFNTAEANGLLTCRATGAEIRLSPRSEQDLLRYFAYELAFIARHALAAVVQIFSTENDCSLFQES